MDQGLRKEAVKAEDEWVGHPRVVQAGRAYVRSAVTGSPMLPGSPAIKNPALNAAP